MLEQGTKDSKYKNVEILPSVVINGRIYRGDMNSYHASQAICDSFQTEPPSCKRFNSVQFHLNEIENNGVKVVSHETHSKPYYWSMITIAMGIIFLIVGACFIKRCLSAKATEHVRSDVDRVVVHHMKMMPSQEMGSVTKV